MKARNFSEIPGNKDTLELLLSRKNEIVPFIGGGFSMPAYPSWDQFLENFFQDIKDEFLLPEEIKIYREIKLESDVNRFEKMTEFLVEKAGRRKFENEVKVHFNVPLPLGMQRKFHLLHRAFPGFKITTNIDSFIEQHGAVSHVNTCYGYDGGKLEGLFSKPDRNILLKIHGGLEDIHSIVATSSQYKAIYGDDRGFDAHALLPAFLKRVFTDRSVLFIGCSLDYDRILMIMESLREMKPHFAVMKRPGSKKERVLINRRLSGLQITPIWIQDFNQVEDILELLAGPSAERPSETIERSAALSIQIKKLVIKNFRGFDYKELVFHDRFNLLLGDNGSGKTAVLDALSLIAGSIFNGFDETAGNYHIKDEDVRRVSNLYDREIRIEANYPAFVEAEGFIMGKPARWRKTLLNKDGKTIDEDSELISITSQFQQPVRQGEPVTLPVIAYYGTGRLWLQRKEREVEPLPPVSRWYGYKDCLDPRSNEKELVRWFKEQELAQIQRKSTSKLYEAVKKAIIDCIEEYREIWFDFREDSIMVKRNDGQCLPANLSSDGYRNMIAMTADIAYRMAIINPHLGAEATRLTSGIVLIDEIDLHLHPNWQRRIVEDLKRTFPNVQFVSTSHSPFIVQSLREPGELIDLESKSKLYEKMDISIEDLDDCI